MERTAEQQKENIVEPEAEPLATTTAQNSIIADKDDDEKNKIEEWRQIAKNELEEWYSKRNATIEATKAANRLHEMEQMSITNELSEVPDWKEVVKMCGQLAKHGKDVSRMKKVMAGAMESSS